ncbi:DEAD/DEAH box helicase [Candidatus Poriferisocius sp.]|uniref:DEAD/DEAH box helicase n=1 Tax=Candidatus Poriferisocius sp. TaxID=3101276 RepID=UPI003B5B88E4
MPLDTLKASGRGQLRLGLIESAGYRTVAAVQKAGKQRLEAISGVGEKTSTQVLAAARRVEAAVRKSAQVRFDVDRRPRGQTELLARLQAYEVAHRLIDPLEPGMDELLGKIKQHRRLARLEVQPILRFFSTNRRKQKARRQLEKLDALINDPTTAQLAEEMARARSVLLLKRANRPSRATAQALWDDYLQRTATYNGLLIEVSGQGLADGPSQGFLPPEIVEKIRGLELDTSLLNPELRLRGYQSFGAKYILVQKKAILGDEMGLGKTIEALAAVSHLRSQGETHFFVVCPASVLANWEHEIARHTHIERIWRVHGPDRNHLFRQWAQEGGIGVTTFSTLRALRAPDVPISALVVDEAHFVKNPGAQRTNAVRTWLGRADHALLMSGTPMENRVEEFRTLVHHVRPDIARTIQGTDGIAGADVFRRSVAPVYLRRNQVDVLSELPEKIETPEWLTLEGPAASVYREAVASRNFMAMRRAAFLTQRLEDSPKMERLLEIALEAADNNRKVVVFSFFREVIARVHEALDWLAVGPITGSVSATDRQRIIDEFTSRNEPAVLVSQIEAGGVGLNIQAASVVILTEPQWKPSTEEQAIARCHRMGQAQRVQVHRLLTENSVDERMLAILARKSKLFAEYVRQSAMKDAAPDAVDVTEDDRLFTDAGRAEQERRIIELERRRLGLDDE